MDKLKNLTEQLYKEGVEKGKNEADQIVSEANKKAEKIVADANKQAEQIIAKANNEASEMKRKMESEMTLSAKQSINKLKNDISNLIASGIAGDSVKGAFDKDFSQKLIMGILENWKEADMKLVVPTSLEKDFLSFVESSVKGKLQGGIDVVSDEGLSTGFKVGPKDSSYVVEFSEESFNGFFQDYLKPTTRNLLFNN